MNRKDSRRVGAAGAKPGGRRWLLLPTLLALSWGAQAQCAGPMNGEQYSACITQTVILPEQLRAREAAERGNAPAREPGREEIERAQAAAVARNGWGAYAASPGLAQIGRASDLSSRGKAEKAALKDCQDQGGKECAVLVAVDNECAVLAHNGGATHAFGIARRETQAAKQALEQCTRQSPDRLCRLQPLSVCPGQGVSFRGERVDPAVYARELEVAYDPRPLWGAVASDGRNLHFVVNATGRERAGALALADCGGSQCALLASAQKENQCLAAAWVPGAAAAPIVVENRTPGDARINALRQCASATGQVCAASPAQCSQRERAAAEGDGSVRASMRLQDVRAEDLRESLQPWVGMNSLDFTFMWSSPDKLEDGGDLRAKRRTLSYDYSIKASGKHPARPCWVVWDEVDGNLEAYALKGEGCRFLFKR
ncbi:DUF4189 domain-containing protein [Pseudomonas sp. CGJS7]|uniref:DUF4189 domain-containing protein n=1 Tax=Pseudomonas sp. CGJS7 TaxID=3109348 RepID=UPI003008047A